MTDPLTPEQFRTFTLAMVMGMGVYWFFLDLYRLQREMRGDRDHDKLFGSWMGLVLAIAGFGGAAKHLWF